MCGGEWRRMVLEDVQVAGCLFYFHYYGMVSEFSGFAVTHVSSDVCPTHVWNVLYCLIWFNG